MNERKGVGNGNQDIEAIGHTTAPAAHQAKRKNQTENSSSRTAHTPYFSVF
jgi:hypothetical protein